MFLLVTYGRLFILEPHEERLTLRCACRGHGYMYICRGALYFMCSIYAIVPVNDAVDVILHFGRVS